jgi:hypothetical protein
VVEPPQVQNRLQPGGYGPGGSAHPSGGLDDSDVGELGWLGGHGEGLRRSHGEAAGEKLGASPVERSTVNVGTTSGSPSPSISSVEVGQVRRRPMALRWGGVLVVVGGQESWPQGEGGQRIRSSGSGRSGDRW